MREPETTLRAREFRGDAMSDGLATRPEGYREGAEPFGDPP